MRKHYLTLNCTQEETEYRLKQQLRIYPPKGIVEERSFKIYKHSPGHFVVNGIHESLFCFYGNYRQDGNRTNLAYRTPQIFHIPYVSAVNLVNAVYYPRCSYQS